MSIEHQIARLDHKLDRIENTLTRIETAMNANEKALIDASDALMTEVDGLGSAYDMSLAKIDDLTKALAAKTAGDDTPDEAAQIQAEVAKLRGRADGIRSKVAAVQDAKDAVSASLTNPPAPTPVPASTGAAVGLEGVPVTPVSAAGPAATGPAVPSTDHTGSDVNAETSDVAPNASTSATPVSPPTPTGDKPLAPDGTVQEGAPAPVTGA